MSESSNDGDDEEGVVVTDPNIGDEIPELLRPSLPASVAKRRAPEPPAAKPVPIPRQREEEPLELDYEKAGVLRDAQDRVVRPPRPASRHRSPRRGVPVRALGIVAGVVVVGAVVYSLWPSESQEQLDIEALLENESMHLDLLDRRGEGVSANVFTATGIFRALETGGWTVHKLADLNTLELASVHQQGYRLSRGKTELQVELVTTKSHAIAERMGTETRAPLLAVVFDNKLMRIYPPTKGADGAAADVAALLSRYRALVLDQRQP